MTLFAPFTFPKSGKTAKNRIALAPMTNMQSEPDGTPGADELRWLLRRAEGDFGIIITCATYVSYDGKGWEGELGISDDKHIAGLKKLAEALHKHHVLALVQLFHGGARASEKVTGKQLWSASAYTVPGNPPKEIRAATAEDIQRVIADFIRGAERAYEAGFDGVELHGAHGYLLHEFLSVETNKRDDEWGGSHENRMKMLRTILKEIRKKMPDDFIVGVRLSPEDRANFKGIDFDDGLRIAKTLTEDGADYIHVSAWEALKKPDKYKDGNKTIIEYYRELLPPEVPVLVAGELWTKEECAKALSLGADMVALGRSAVGNPDFPKLSRVNHFQPVRPPYSKEYLQSVQVSGRFVEYLRRWKDFVEAE